jgi:hypothetical protein
MPRSSTNLPSVPPSVAQDERREWLRIDDRLLLEYRLVTEPADRPARARRHAGYDRRRGRETDGRAPGSKRRTAGRFTHSSLDHESRLVAGGHVEGDGRPASGIDGYRPRDGRQYQRGRHRFRLRPTVRIRRSIVRENHPATAVRPWRTGRLSTWPLSSSSFRPTIRNTSSSTLSARKPSGCGRAASRRRKDSHWSSVI